MTTEQMTPSERSRTDVVEGTLVQPALPAAHTAVANPAPVAPAAIDPGVSDTSAGWGTRPQGPGGWSLKAVVLALTITALVAGGGGFLAGQAFGGAASSTGTTQQGPGGGFPGGGQNGGQQGGFPGGGQFPGGGGQNDVPAQDPTAEGAGQDGTTT